MRVSLGAASPVRRRVLAAIALLALTISGQEAVLRDVLLRERNALKDVAFGDLTVEGDMRAVAAFFEYFDPPSDTPASIVVR